MAVKDPQDPDNYARDRRPAVNMGLLVESVDRMTSEESGGGEPLFIDVVSLLFRIENQR